MQQAQAQLVPTWTYQTIQPDNPQDMIEMLNALGSECWELVGVVHPELGAPILVLKKLSGFMAAAAETPLVVGAALPMPGSGPRRLS